MAKLKLTVLLSLSHSDWKEQLNAVSVTVASAILPVSFEWSAPANKEASFLLLITMLLLTAIIRALSAKYEEAGRP